jgi:hypothetical protein
MRPNIFTPEFFKNIPADWMTTKKFVGRTITHIYEKQPIAAVYKLGDYANPLPVAIVSADDKQGLVMQPIEKTSLVAFIDSNCLVVLCDDHGKYQFMINQVSVANGTLHALLPNEVMKIQRREDFRVQGPADENFKLVLHLGAGQEFETKIMNISEKGVLLDMRKGVIEPELGRVWYNAYFERLKSKSGPFTLVVKTISPGAAIDRIRCGCVLENPNAKTHKDFESTCHAISNSRASGTLNRWYQDVNWIESVSV